MGALSSLARARSRALASCKAAAFSRSSRASARKARLLLAALARAMCAAAARAWRPRVSMRAARPLSVCCSVMRGIVAQGRRPGGQAGQPSVPGIKAQH